MASQLINALVVDDDPIARRTIGNALSEEWFCCAYAPDGDEAIKRISSEQFDLIITDLRMPKKHGYALAKEILALNPSPMVVVHSSIDDPRLTKDLILMGVDDIVYKPTNYAAIAAKFRGLILRRKQSNVDDVGNQCYGSIETVQTSYNKKGTVTQSTMLDTVPPSDPSRGRELHRDAGSHKLPISNVAHTVFLLADRGEITPGEIASLIARDDDLTVGILTLANSRHYNFKGTQTIDLTEAVNRIGLRKVGEIAMVLSSARK